MKERGTPVTKPFISPVRTLLQNANLACVATICSNLNSAFVRRRRYDQFVESLVRKWRIYPVSMQRLLQYLFWIRPSGLQLPDQQSSVATRLSFLAQPSRPLEIHHFKKGNDRSSLRIQQIVTRLYDGLGRQTPGYSTTHHQEPLSKEPLSIRGEVSKGVGSIEKSTLLSRFQYWDGGSFRTPSMEPLRETRKSQEVPGGDRSNHATSLVASMMIRKSFSRVLRFITLNQEFQTATQSRLVDTLSKNNVDYVGNETSTSTETFFAKLFNIIHVNDRVLELQRRAFGPLHRFWPRCAYTPGQSKVLSFLRREEIGIRSLYPLLTYDSTRSMMRMRKSSARFSHTSILPSQTEQTMTEPQSGDIGTFRNVQSFFSRFQTNWRMWGLVPKVVSLDAFTYSEIRQSKRTFEKLRKPINERPNSYKRFTPIVGRVQREEEKQEWRLGGVRDEHKHVREQDILSNDSQEHEASTLTTSFAIKEKPELIKKLNKVREFDNSFIHGFNPPLVVNAPQHFLQAEARMGFGGRIKTRTSRFMNIQEHSLVANRKPFRNDLPQQQFDQEKSTGLTKDLEYPSLKSKLLGRATEYAYVPVKPLLNHRAFDDTKNQALTNVADKVGLGQNRHSPPQENILTQSQSKLVGKAMLSGPVVQQVADRVYSIILSRVKREQELRRR